MPHGLDSDDVDDLMQEASRAEADARLKRLKKDRMLGEDCPHCGEQITESNLHLTCF